MTRALRPGVILDRDGTLIDIVRDEETGLLSVAFHPSQLRFLPGVVAGLGVLAARGVVLAIATNQPGPAKGQFSRAAVERTNAALVDSLAREGIPIASVEVCYHHPQGGPGAEQGLVFECECRKPKPGLLLALIERLALDPARTIMIGDSASDVVAARAAGIHAALVFAKNRCELCPLRSGPNVTPDLVAERLDLLVAEVEGFVGGRSQ